MYVRGEYRDRILKDLFEYLFSRDALLAMEWDKVVNDEGQF
jgi:hypothetical protein